MALSTILVVDIGLGIPGPAGGTSGIFTRTPTEGTVVPVGVRFPLIFPSVTCRVQQCPHLVWYYIAKSGWETVRFEGTSVEV
jgi:hypothetical protein